MGHTTCSCTKEVVFQLAKLVPKHMVLDAVCSSITTWGIIEVKANNCIFEAPARDAKKCIALLVDNRVFLCRVHKACALETL